MENCSNCNTNYKFKLGQEPGLCTKCTNLVLDTKEKLLKSVKYALHSKVYYPQIQVIEKQREKLNEKDKKQRCLDL